MKKKIATLAIAGIMAATMLAGCGKLESDDVIVTVDSENITAGVANFYARYTQAQVEAYSSAYMGEDMWSTEIEDGKTYEETVKEDVLESLETMLLLEKHMSDYDVSITDEDKAGIKAAAEEFSGANGLAEKEEISGEPENVERVLTLITVQQKMQEAIKAGADKEVSDDEAAQKKMQYVIFPFSTKDESGNTTDLTDDEKKKLKETADKFAESAKTAGDFAALAKEQGAESTDATFSADNTTLPAELVEAADKLKEGETTAVVESTNGYYVAKVTSLFDKEATEAQKENIISEREQDLYNETTEQWLSKAEVKVNKSNWKKVDFNKLGVTIKQEEEVPYADDVKTQEQAQEDQNKNQNQE